MRQKSLVKLFAIVFVLFAVGTILVNGYMTYVAETGSYHRECVEDLREHTVHFLRISGKKGYEYLLTISWNAYVRLPIDLAAKYYSKTMDEKYKNKERKDVSVSLANVERKRYCSACGREMSVYDADIQEASGQEPICNECMKKALKK